MARGTKFKPEEVIAKLREAEVKRLNELEKKNARLKRLFAGAGLEKATFKWRLGTP